MKRVFYFLILIIIATHFISEQGKDKTLPKEDTPQSTIVYPSDSYTHYYHNYYSQLYEVNQKQNYEVKKVDKKEEVEDKENFKDEEMVKTLSHDDSQMDERSHNYETFEITAYTAGIESTGKTPDHPEYGITASGKTVEEGTTIACPPSMEFGTQIYIPYFDNTFTCHDRGSAIVEGHLDVYMEDLDDALEFGRRDLPVEILKD